ncbi:MAG: hypothetical protein ABIP07_04035 [Sphingomicrobium sp.]
MAKGTAAPRDLVNCLLTISIKVNVPFYGASRRVKKGTIMKIKKAGATRGLWSWLFGHGWSGGGGSG